MPETGGGAIGGGEGGKPIHIYSDKSPLHYARGAMLSSCYGDTHTAIGAGGHCGERRGIGVIAGDAAGGGVDGTGGGGADAGE
jgi:hypothetical protein